jgi:hypothetical protein
MRRLDPDTVRPLLVVALLGMLLGDWVAGPHTALWWAGHVIAALAFGGLVLLSARARRRPKS